MRKINKEFGLYEDLILEWQLVLSGIYEAAKKNSEFQPVEVTPEKIIIINHWQICALFINNDYIRVEVSKKTDKDKNTFFEIRNDPNNNMLTINLVLNFICKTRL